MAALDVIASELLKSAREADLKYKKTRDQAERDKAIRLRKIVENLKLIIADGLTPTLDEVLAVGNTSTNTLNVGGITTDYVQLDTAATPTLQPGMFAWNDQEGTADLRLKGGNVTLQVGQETLARVVNKTGADLLESQYKVVRVRIASEGGSQGQRLAVVLAQGNNDPDSVTTLGLVTENIANNQEGFITIFGNVNGINTTGSLQGETWVDGDVLFLSPTTPGALTKVKPVAPNHTVVVGYVLYAHGVNGKIFVKVDNGYELDELHNVKITSVANNDLIQYDSTQQVWKNVPVATAVPTPTLAAVTTAGNTTTNAITVGGLTVATNLIYTDTVNSRVGIGTNSPAVTLHVQNGGSTPKALFQHGTLAHLGVIIGSTGGGFTVEDNNFFAIWHQDYANRSNETGLTERMRITTGGNILIGTTTDAGYKLDVNGTFKTTSFWTTSSGRAQWGNSLTAYGTLTWDTGYARIHATSGNRLDLGASEGLHMTISTAGNIGIGTTSPNYKVDVQGTTLATSTISAQGAFNIARVAAPTGTLTLTPSTGGSIDVGQHYYFVSFVTALGETTVALVTGIIIVSGTQTVTITGIPTSTDARVTGRRIYRTRAGQTSDRGALLTTINDNTTTSYVDTVADSTLANTGDWAAYRENTTSRQITIDGTRAMLLGTGLTSIGFGAGASVTTAGLTTLVGYNAGNAITYGFQNTLVGTQAGRFVTTGDGNTVLGAYSLMWTSTGADNIAIGRGAIFYNVTGSYNIAVGGGALSGQSGASHSSNIAIGNAALASLGAANNNVALGYYAGRYISSGSVNTLSSNSIFIGYDARPNADSEANQIVIGYNARGLGSNTTVIGNSSTTFTSIPAGNLAVGTTTNSGYKLEVNGGPINIVSGYSEPTAEAGYRLKFADNGGINNDSGIGLSGALGNESLWINKGSANGSIRFMFGTLGEKVTFTSAGNVGIGTTSPLYPLDVNGITKLRTATYFGQISQPSAPTLGTNSTTGGTLPANTYTYRITALDFWNVETTPSNTLVVTTTGSTSSVSMSWPLVQGAYSYRIYRTNSGGTTVYYVTFGTNSTSFTDTGAATNAGTLPSVNNTAYGLLNTNGQLRTGNITVANNGVGNYSSIIFDKSTDSPQINVVEYANDSTMFEFALADNPDGPDVFHFVMPDWQNPSSGWKPFKFAAFTTQIVGQNTNFWSSFSLPSSTPYYTTNPESLANSQIKWDPYTSTSYNLIKDNGTGTGVFNVDVTGFTGANNTIYWVTIQAGATTFNWGNGASGSTPVGTGVAITGGWQTLSNGVQVKITGAVLANDRWAFRAFPVPRMGIGTTTPIAPLQVSTTVRPTSAVARGVYFNPTLVATANNDVLVGLDVAPTFTAGAFTGVLNLAARFSGRVHLSYSSLTFSGSAGNSADLQLTTNGFVAWNQNFNISGSSATNYLTLFNTTGNLLLQNGGTFTDAGYRLDVNGTARVQSNFTVDTDTLYVDASNNRVGIGTTSPTDKLHIIDSNNANIFGRITATGTNASAAWVAMNNQNDNVVYRVFGDGVSGSQMGISLVRSASLMANLGGSGKFLVGTFSSTDFVLGTGNTERARFVDSTGNFLIGTTSDNGNRLQVSGTIDGQAFAVNGVNGWTGTIVIMTNPPGQQNIQVDSGIITNVF